MISFDNDKINIKPNAAIMLQPLNQHATLSIKIGPHGAKMRQYHNTIMRHYPLKYDNPTI